MSGKPAARQGDMTQYGGPIVQGSAGVRIGAPTGVACSVCPGGMTSGNPVNPLLGAKVLPGETDLALPGPLPFILSRTYSSYRTKTPAPVGVFGPGWKAPSDIRLQLRDDGLILNDNGGRSIHFEPLLPGEAVYSRSESMWLVRGGKAAQPDGHTLARLWGALPPDIRLSPHLYLATNSAQGPWWILGWSERVPGAEDVLPAPLPPYRVLTGMADRFGLTVEQLARQVEPEYTPARKAHLYHCDHRGLPLALISEDGNTAWSAEYDEWGNQLNEENPHHVYQPYRLPGQQHDEESGLYYNRHRYYDPLQGRYITQDPMGLKGGWNLYQYPLNPLQQIDPMGLLQTWDDARSGACTGGVCGVLSRIIGPSKFDSTADAALDALKETQNRSLCNDMEYSGIVCKDTNGKYFASKAETDNLRKESYPLKRKCPTGTDRVAAYHTHGADSHGDYVDEFFSSSDKNLVRSKDNNLEAFYLATPDGRFEALNNKGEYIFIRNSVPGLSSVCIPYHD
ncbi:TPA: RHS repeat protein [Escherichia coli]|nr:RHS repeat protein [Escherichia coli]